MKNKQIYEYGKNLAIFDNFNLSMPVRISFYLQKNISLIRQANTDIEMARMNIGKAFGTINNDGTGYNIPPEKIPEVNKELEDLFNLEQDLNLHMFKLDDFDGIDLPPTGIEDASMLPKLFEELRRRGYSETDLDKIASVNFFNAFSC